MKNCWRLLGEWDDKKSERESFSARLRDREQSENPYELKKALITDNPEAAREAEEEMLGLLDEFE